MSKKIVYTEGEIVGPHNAIFIKELQPKLSKQGKNIRQAEFSCGFCGEHFVTDPALVRRGVIKSCGCACTIQASKKAAEKRDKEVIGARFGKLTVISNTGKRTQDKARFAIYLCRCDCGNLTEVSIGNLRTGNTKSCGCLRKENIHRLHLEGQKIGKLTVLEYLGGSKWSCQCECGNIVTRTTGTLRKGNCSCGCESSKGESALRKLLQELNISFEQEKTFDVCRNPKTGRLLRFDFYLPEYNCCIEYDGRQHTGVNGSFADSEGAENIQYRDWIKTTFCQDNNIGLVRIPDYQYSNINKEDLLWFIKNNMGLAPLYTPLNKKVIQAFKEYDQRR